MNERPIPEAAQLDPNSVEMIRVWIANKKLHTSIKVGMYKESTKISEEVAWGKILADVARHVVSALQEGYQVEPESALSTLQASFNSELGSPTTEAKGGFLRKH